MCKNTDENCIMLIDRLAKDHTLSTAEYATLINGRNERTAEYARKKAVEARNTVYGTDVFVRGLIEISNYCRNDCLYCGIRRSNRDCTRYRLSKEQIIACCRNGYALGMRTFVLQGGEDNHFSDDMICEIVKTIKSQFPDCAVTLSLGEKTEESYRAYYEAGADRYLLRHETSNAEHYSLLHPPSLSHQNRIQCLHTLKNIGYQVGCGFMVGSPHQTAEHLAQDLKFTEDFSPDMCGIGPFIPHHCTPFANEPRGSVEMTTYLLSLIRLIKPNILLPATTALGTIDPNGREKGILAGANVIMPNLSPPDERKKYELYDNKLCSDEEAAENIARLKEKISRINHRIVVAKGDIRKGEQ